MNPSYFADFVAGETVRQRLTRWVKNMNGASLSNRLPDLTGLVARGVDDPQWASGVVQWKTNCATSALGFIAAICGGVDSLSQCHPLLAKRSVNGTSMARVLQIGVDSHALVQYDPHGQQPKGGDLLHYGVRGLNDDHVEWLLSDIDENGCADHGGGGRMNNAITVGTGPVLSSMTRPIMNFIDLDKLNIPTSDLNEST